MEEFNIGKWINEKIEERQKRLISDLEKEKEYKGQILRRTIKAGKLVPVGDFKKCSDGSLMSCRELKWVEDE